MAVIIVTVIIIAVIIVAVVIIAMGGLRLMVVIRLRTGAVAVVLGPVVLRLSALSAMPVGMPRVMALVGIGVLAMVMTLLDRVVTVFMGVGRLVVIIRLDLSLPVRMVMPVITVGVPCRRRRQITASQQPNDPGEQHRCGPSREVGW
jgi:hypothetical protein